MQNNPLVSILIVAHNPGDYLFHTLKSCLNQTYANTEILLLDNASNENIETYIPEEWKDKIRLIKNTANVGPYVGLNFLLEKAKWDYIAIQDHDDIWHPEKIEKQITFLEEHPEYIGSGTKTIMYYESDNTYFEYFLERENYYTIHPSLVFRNNTDYRYNTENQYFCDAYFQKKILCKGEKKIYNLDESLTTHIIKASSSNYSYRWYTISFKNLKRAYEIHSIAYATLTTGWEIMRKCLYPILVRFHKEAIITKIERIPFILFGNTMYNSKDTDWWRH